MHKGYNHKTIEKKWQDIWQKDGVYQTSFDTSKPKKYILDMFPYPSGAGLHVGHPKGYIATDILSRMYRMQGFNVLHPMGWDAFGLPAEQFAIKNQIHPKTAVDKNVETYKRQLQMIGLDYDWSRELNTTDPAYYKWTQWAFLRMFKKGLAFESYEPINWCPSCKTGLANEDLEDGKCERCGSVIEQKPLRQWVLRITDYAERMLADLDTLDRWPESVKTSQRNWIGKSVGAEITFPLVVKDSNYTIPEFVDEKNPPVEGKQTKERKTIHAIVYSKERDAYLTLKWKNYDWHTIVVGGVDEDENIIESARREVQEETGYTDLVFKGILGGEVRSQYFAAHKDENRVAVTTALYFELGSENKIEVSEEESSIHNAVWVPRAEFKPEEMTNIELPLWFERIQELEKNTVKVFTTRPDTLFGVTYLVLAPEHSLVAKLLENQESGITNKEEVRVYIEETKKKSPLDRQKGTHSTSSGQGKTGVELQGIKAINPANGEEVPVWIADYVLADYGTGAVMAVPAHDERDFEFAKKYDLPIKEVIAKKFIGIGDRAEKEGFEILNRKTIDPIIHDKNDEFYYLIREPNGDVHFAGGGVEFGESEYEAVKREVTEETGFVDFEIGKRGSFHVMHGFRITKQKNQRTDGPTYEVILNSLDRIDSEIEEGKHELIKVKKEDVLKTITWEHHKYLFEKYLQETTFVENGVLVNSGEFNGLTSEQAKAKITEFVGGEMKTTYKLKDWVFSRQRYWGEPIPIVHVDRKAYPLAEEQLPLKLPEVENYEPSDSGESPLADISEWVNVRGFVNSAGEFVVSEDGELVGRRETNTMPQWAGSCWYYLRYIDPNNNKALVSEKLEQYWLGAEGPERSRPEQSCPEFVEGSRGVDVYVGGMEHATRHLIYARFWHKFLFDIGVVSTTEPFMELHAPGLILAEDGRKMSKRWGNVVNPDDMVDRFGADAFRLYEAFMGPFNDAIAWNTDGLVGTRRFVEKVTRYFESWLEDYKEDIKDSPEISAQQYNSEFLNTEIDKLIYKTIKKVSVDIPQFKFNTAISALMVLFNELQKDLNTGFTETTPVTIPQIKKILQLLAPFAPHITEELWHELGNTSSIHTSEWPQVDESKLISDTVEIVVQVNGKLRAKIEVASNAAQDTVYERAMQEENVQKFMEGTPKKIIFVPNKILNIVV